MCYNISNLLLDIKDEWIVLQVLMGDTLEMKKPHPCGSHFFTVLRSGMDFRLVCQGCNREFMISRRKAEKNIKRITRGNTDAPQA